MKRKSCLQTAAALLLILAMTLGLVGCPAPDSGDGTSTTTPTVGDPKPPTPTPTDYANPAAIPGTGDTLAADAPILAEPAVNEAGATQKTAQEMTALFRSQNGLSDGGTYAVTDGKPFTTGAKGRAYEGNGGTVIAPAGIVIKDVKNCSFANITFVGAVSLEGCENITFQGVTFLAADGTALSLDAATTGTVIRDSRIEGKTALDSRADSTYLLDSYVRFTSAGIADAAPAVGIYIRGTRIEGTGTAIATAGDNAEIRRSTVRVGKSDTAVAIGAGENILLAECMILDAQTGLSLSGTHNASLVRNTLISATFANTTHVSFGDNAVGGRLSAYDNGYLLLNGSLYPADGKDHAAAAAGNTHAMGNNILDVDARLESGADERLLHQFDRDLFTYMEKKDTVRSPEGDLRVTDYILSHAAADDFVILAPGNYRSYSALALREKHSGTVIYAYGAFLERVAEGAEDNEGTALYYGIDNVGADHVTVKGLTLGFERESTAQAYVVEIDRAASRVRVIAGAGLANDIGATSEWYESGTLFGYRAGDFRPYADLKYKTAAKNSDGTIWISFDSSNAAQRSALEQIRVGDALSARARVHGQYYHNVRTEEAVGVVYEDVVNYAHSNSFAFYEYGADAVVYNRVVDTTRAGKIIDEEIYNQYKALEAQYGISFDVYKDGDNYRGCPMRAGSVDGIHTHTSVHGSQVTSSLFENLLDDGTNQKSSYSRLSHIVNNGDGTATVVFKGTFSGVYDTNPSASITPNQWGRFPQKGEKVFLYSLGSGEVICEGTALSGTVSDGTRTTIWNTEVRCYKFTVAADTVDWEIYQSFVARGVMDSPSDRLSVLDSSDMTYKIAVDNASYLSTGARFDNTVVRNTRSRGLLIKTSDVAITNCTIENTGSSGIKVCNEGEWGESGRSRNVDIKNNLFLYTGYRGEAPKNAAIWICGVGAESKLSLPLDKLLSGDITIEGNVMRNRPSPYAITLWGVDNVTVRNNDLGRKVDMDGLTRQKFALHIDQCKNVTLEGNTFPDPTMINSAAVSASRYIGLGGKDLGTAFPDSPNV